jgi:Protein of unknown function (DUF1203)
LARFERKNRSAAAHRCAHPAVVTMDRGDDHRIAEARVLGHPCRVSLTDSQEGDERLLVNYEHHPVASPYRMRFAVTCAGARRPTTPSTRCPSSCAGVRLRCRRDDSRLRVGRWDGNFVAGIEKLLDPRAAYLHMHSRDIGP